MIFNNSVVADTLNTAAAVAADTAGQSISHAAGEHGEKFNFMHLLDHIKDSRIVELPVGHIELPKIRTVNIGGLMLDLSPTKHVFFLILCALLLVVVFVYVARASRKSFIPHGISNLVEMIVVFIRDEVAISNMGAAGVKYVPYLLTTFFYILVMNLCGLIPYGATPTGNIMVTAGLASVAFIMIQYSAMKSQGIKRYFAHLTGGVHWSLWLIMIPIEILGLFTKPFALCLRLFANMTGGHIVILSLIGLIFLFRSFVLAPIPVIFAIGIYLLELFVAFLQAYVFTMLTALFMGLGMKHETNHKEQVH